MFPPKTNIISCSRDQKQREFVLRDIKLSESSYNGTSNYPRVRTTGHQIFHEFVLRDSRFFMSSYYGTSNYPRVRTTGLQIIREFVLRDSKFFMSSYYATPNYSRVRTTEPMTQNQVGCATNITIDFEFLDCQLWCCR